MVQQPRRHTFSVRRRPAAGASSLGQGMLEILVAVGLLAILVILFVRFRGIADRPLPLGGDQAVPVPVDVESERPVRELQE